ncbi:MAG: glycosyltransferase family 39 protein [Bacteroidia bacterium]
MKLFGKKYFAYYFLFFIVLISRLPFLSAGYGVEEDSWGIALAGFHTHTTGIYEPSRFPGHPVHEYIYSAFYGHSYFFYNFFSALFSAIAAVVFAAILKHLNFRYAFLAAFAMAFTPVVYISSTYTIDFMWTLAFMLMSFYWLLKERYIICGLVLGLAIGCRITMGAMLLPFLLILWYRPHTLKNFSKIAAAAMMMAVLVFLPLIKEFGASFFMYYDQFPYPPATKVFYKMIIGVFGLAGTIALIVCKALYLFKKDWATGKLFSAAPVKGLLSACFLACLLFTISYFRLPQKSGYMITTIPFILILAGYFLNSKWFITLCFSLMISPFILGINLTDRQRGSEYSKYAMKFKVSGQEIFLDPFKGPLFSDYSKRKQKMKYTAEVISRAANIESKTVVIAGWWYNEIMMERRFCAADSKIRFVSYIDKEQISRLADEGYSITFLPEQDLYNDQMFGMNVTGRFAKPY